ncbi:MAG TPA: AAC(3) family N-acetyltransferase [Victivallales bacterium]|nr:AAC(3) family N-acetyltransferase [Victivallales bacterium]
MKKPLFVCGSKEYFENDLAEKLSSLDISGKTVLVYSRLLSFGRISSERSVREIIQVIKKQIGPKGTLCIPSYSLSAYNNEVFDPENSKCIVGQLGEVARKMRGFKRTFHPVYSNAISGKNTRYLLKQSPNTCFGDGSFFDLFSKIEDARLLFIGTPLNAATIVHLYDQRCSAPGRFIKFFQAKCLLNGKIINIKFDSYVRDPKYYDNKIHCLAPVELIADSLKVIKRKKFASDWIHMIKESDFARIYSAFHKNGMTDRLLASREDQQEYYQRNNFHLYKKRLGSEELNYMKKLIKLVI